MFKAKNKISREAIEAEILEHMKEIYNLAKLCNEDAHMFMHISETDDEFVYISFFNEYWDDENTKIPINVNTFIKAKDCLIKN